MNNYSLETSPDKVKWTKRAAWREGDPSRFGPPMSPDIMILEAKSFIDAWRARHQGYDSDVKDAIHDRKYVRIIIEL